MLKSNIIFLHIPKTGGTTLNSLLERVYWHQRKNMRTIKHFSEYPAFTQEDKNKHTGIQVLKGHIPYGAHEYLIGDSVYFTFLRNPIQRTLSNYYYAISQRGEGISNYLIDNDISLEQYIEENIAPWVFNEQTKYLAGAQSGKEIASECNEEQYQSAIAHIKDHFALVGLTEYFDESLLLLKKKLNWRYPYYHVKNVTKRKRPPLSDRMKEIIAKRNSYDMRLYEYAKKQLHQCLTEESFVFQGQMPYFRLMNQVFRKLR